MSVQSGVMPNGDMMEPVRPAPKGRPPKGHVWEGFGYVHRESLKPYSREEHAAILAELWRQARLLRYSRDERGFRTKRRTALERARRAKGAKPRRKRLANSTLTDARSDPEELKGDTDKSIPE